MSDGTVIMDRMAIDTDYAWAAGFFDGEGTVGVNRGAPNKLGVQRAYLRITVAQKPRPLLDRFQAIFEGGNVYHDKKRNMHTYSAASQPMAFAVICHIWPYIGEQKRRDFVRAIAEVRRTRELADQARGAGRECAAEDCETIFYPDGRQFPFMRFCSKRCLSRVVARKKRGPAPVRHCKGCGGHPDERTRGCRRCMTRHWERKRRGAESIGAL
jgi:hypothetical protein